MMTGFIALLLITMAGCVQGDIFSGNTNMQTVEENSSDTHVLDQVLQELRYLKEEDKKNKDAINSLQEQTTNSQVAVASAAFMARMDVGNFYPFPGDVIPFNVALLNVGGHYDALNSVFTCAESGLYLFSVTLYSGAIKVSTNDQMSGALMLDGVNVAQVHSESWNYDHAQAHQAAVTAVVECPKGGSVWPECLEGNSQIYGSSSQPSTVFTGFAITYSIHP